MSRPWPTVWVLWANSSGSEILVAMPAVSIQTLGLVWTMLLDSGRNASPTEDEVPSNSSYVVCFPPFEVDKSCQCRICLVSQLDLEINHVSHPNCTPCIQVGSGKSEPRSPKLVKPSVEVLEIGSWEAWRGFGKGKSQARGTNATENDGNQ